MNLVNEVLGKFKALAATRAVPELKIGTPRATDTIARHFADFSVSIAVAKTNVHSLLPSSL
jgi:hypothetical protein